MEDYVIVGNSVNGEKVPINGDEDDNTDWSIEDPHTKPYNSKGFTSARLWEDD